MNVFAKVSSWKDGNVFRSDIHTNGRQASVSSIFHLKIDNPKSKELPETAKTTESGKETKLDATFHAALNRTSWLAS